MSFLETRFYVTGGTLQWNSPSYVERRADVDLYQGLVSGEFCYVLTSRQMGKSSLMVRTAARLREAGIAVAVLDLTALGQNMSPEQWYGGLLLHVGRALDMEDEVEEFWLEKGHLAPLQRWILAIREVVLPQVGVGRQALGVGDGNRSETAAANTTTGFAGTRPTPNPRPLVIFVDEIDAVRSLPFSTDEFFAGIRECYNRRSEEPEFNRLTFCLLGVASPSDLIQDTRTTPFNIGRRIELTDFSPAEAAPLAQGLVPGEAPLSGVSPRKRERDENAKATGTGGCPDVPVAPSPSMPVRFAVLPFSRFRGEEAREPTGGSPGLAAGLLKRALYWTGGHPYLTQRLCRAIAEANAVPDAADAHPGFTIQDPQSVDRLCHELFLSPGARDRDDNLLFVRERLLKNEADRGGLLDLYRQIRSGRRVPAGEANPLVDILRLSGIATVQDREVKGTPFGRGLLGLLPLATGLPEGSLRVRNRIYERVFDREWVTANMPDAELRRQQAAYRRGLVRATTLSGAVLAVMAGLTLTAVNLAHRERLARFAAFHNLQVANLRTWQANKARAAEQKQRQIAVQAALRATEEQKKAEDARQAEHDAKQLAVSAASEASRQRDQAQKSAAVATTQRRIAQEQALAARRQRYVAQMNLAWEALKTRSYERLAHLLNAQIPAPGEEDLRGFEWRYLWRLCHRDRMTLPVRESDRVTAVQFLPDGQRLLTGNAFHAFQLWDLASGKAFPAFPELPLSTSFSSLSTAQAISADTSMIAEATFSPARSGASGHGSRWDVTVWNRSARRLLRFSGRNQGEIVHLVFSPDSNTLAAGTADPAPPFAPGDVKFWDLTTSRGTTLRGHASAISSLAFSPDGKTLASGCEDGSVRLWDASQRQGTTLLQTRQGAIYRVAFSPDGRVLAIGTGAASGQDVPGQVILWDLTTGRKRALHGHEGPVTDLAFSPDGRTLASTSSDSTIRLWNVATGREIDRFEGHVGWIAYVAFSPDGRLLATAGRDQTVRLWDVGTAPPPDLIQAHENAILRMAFCRRGRLLATAGVDWAVRLWDTATMRQLANFRIPQTDSGLATVSFSPDGRRLAVCTRGTAWLCDLGANRKSVLPRQPKCVTAVAFSPDGKMLAAGGEDGTVKLWNFATRREGTLQGHRRRVDLLAFSGDGGTLATHSIDGTVRVWCPAARREVACLHDRPDIDCLTLSPSGQVLVVSNGKNLRRWEIGTRRQVPFAGHQSQITSLVFAPDGRTLATAARDSTVKLWTVSTSEEVGVLTGASGPIWHLAFSPDGRTLAAGSEAGTVRVWRADSLDEAAARRIESDMVGSGLVSHRGRRLKPDSRKAKSYDHESAQYSLSRRLEMRLHARPELHGSGT